VSGDLPHRPEDQLLLRRRDAAQLLSVSQSQIEAWARSGVLKVIRLPGLRAVRFSRSQVLGLVRQLEHDAGIHTPPEAA
jgi:excisionase family DNA binding protein